MYALGVHRPLEKTKIRAPSEVVVEEVVMGPCQY